MSLPIALQLYTVRDETAKDFIGTLEKVAEIGYEGVEFAGFGDILASKMKEALEKLNLKAVGSHTSKELLFNKLDEVIEYNLAIGNPFVICPWDNYGSREEWLNAAKLYNGIGKKLKQRGLQFLYHNHAHEFGKFDGEYILDLIYRETDPQLVKAEIDTYWVHYAGVDPAGYVAKYGGRCPIVHLKDMNAEDKSTVEVGEGIIDIKSIIEASVKAGAEWLVVEQDSCARPSLESVKISLENLKKMR